MIINEIFTAPQGEGLWAGMPMVFVRLQGCNLRCAFCDTPYAIGREGNSRDVYELRDWLVDEYGDSRVVCFTGGEPLLQIGEVIEIADYLQQSGWKVHLETNGTVGLLDSQLRYFDWITLSPKGPNWRLCIPGSAVKELKFVMPPKDEFDADLPGRVWAGLSTIMAYTKACPEAFLWLQPRSNEPSAIGWCVEMLDALQVHLRPSPLTMGLSVQVHKFIGSK